MQSRSCTRSCIPQSQRRDTTSHCPYGWEGCLKNGGKPEDLPYFIEINASGEKQRSDYNKPYTCVLRRIPSSTFIHFIN